MKETTAADLRFQIGMLSLYGVAVMVAAARRFDNRG